MLTVLPFKFLIVMSNVFYFLYFPWDQCWLKITLILMLLFFFCFVSWFGFWPTFILKTNCKHSGTLHRKVTQLTFQGLFWVELTWVCFNPGKSKLHSYYGCSYFRQHLKVAQGQLRHALLSQKGGREGSQFFLKCAGMQIKKKKRKGTPFRTSRTEVNTTHCYIPKTRVKFSLDFALDSERDGCSFYR